MQPLDTISAARLLRELAAELQQAQGPARNGLFLELHRLHDTIFRLSLESHPDLPPELLGTAFNLEEPLSAPQVVRELNRLGTPLATKEIRNLYKHMNMARNNLAHEAVIDRTTISNANVKRMVQLATLVAEVLDPNGAHPSAHVRIVARRRMPWSRVNLIVGLLMGLSLCYMWLTNSDTIVNAALTLAAIVVFGGLWLFGR